MILFLENKLYDLTLSKEKSYCFKDLILIFKTSHHLEDRLQTLLSGNGLSPLLSVVMYF